MPSDTMSGKGGRRSGADRRSKFITPYLEFTYSGPERRSDTERRSGEDRRLLADRRNFAERRFVTERREFEYTSYVPERRSGIDRRLSSCQ
jgi:hypothetical protein